MIPCRFVLWVSSIISVIVFIALLFAGIFFIQIANIELFLAALLGFSLVSLLFSMIGLVLLRGSECVISNKKIIKSFACIIFFALLLFIFVLFASAISILASGLFDLISFIIFIFITLGLITSILQTVLFFIYTNYCNINEKC